MRSASGRATLALVFNALFWGVSWIPLRAVQAHGLHPLWATALVFGVALLGLVAWQPQAWRAWAARPALWFLFLAAGLGNAAFNWAVSTGDVIRVALLFYTMPAWVVLLAWWILGERPTAFKIAQLVLAMVGVAVVLKRPDMAWPLPESLPDYLSLLAGAAFAVATTLLRRLHTTPTGTRMLVMFSGGLTMSVVCAGLAGLFAASASPDLALPNLTQLPSSGWLWTAALCLGFLASNAAYQYSATRLSPVTASLIMLTEVLFASLSSVAMGVSEITLRLTLGGALIVAAAALAAWGDRPAVVVAGGSASAN
jgi:drug/metabolite transporter (DMT)-like permease